MYNHTQSSKIAFFKIGGSCLVGAESFYQMVLRIREIVREKQGTSIITLSAFSGMTTVLEELFEKVWDMSPKMRENNVGNESHNLAVNIRQKYVIPLYSMTGANKRSAVLASEAEVDRLCSELSSRLLMREGERKDISKARVLAFGEECSVAITRFVLEHVYNTSCDYLHASKLITTEDVHKGYCIDNTIAMSSTEQKVKLYAPVFATSIRPVLIEGFIGENMHHKQTVLEREGSDVTAAALARAFVNLGWDVPFVRYYKNVGGVWKHEPSPEEIAQGDGFEERIMLRDLLGITLKAKQKILHPDAIRVLMGNGLGQPRIPVQIALFSTGVVGTKIY